MTPRRWTEKQLRNAISESFTYRQVLAKIGLRPTGGNYKQIKKYILEYRCEISHFKGRGWNRGLKGMGINRIPLEKILVQGSNFQTFKLKKRLFRAALKPQYCEECHWAERSPDGYLPLELDHINGDPHDNRLENLRVLCPNCHSLKPTHRGRMRRIKAQVAE